MPASTARSNPPPKTQKARGRDQVQKFWDRVSEGLEVDQLWTQFKVDARSSYRLYQREIAQPDDGLKRGKRGLEYAKSYFWAVLTKLSPARRVLLLVGLLLFFFPTITVSNGEITVGSAGMHAVGGVIFLALLVLEIADRVTMKRDLEIAREIQMWLTPVGPPQVPGLDVGFVNRPANTVAGDYYDVFARKAEDDSERALMIVADVAGKSLPAALLMATLQASLKTLAARASSLNDLVAGLNVYSCAHSNGGRRFTTAFIADYDPVTRKLAYVNAGHNAPMLRRADGTVERLDKGGVPLGIDPGANYACEELQLGVGDLLFVFTDGLVEAENEKGQEYGEAGLVPLLNHSKSAPAQQILQLLMADMTRFTGMAHQHDDITCLLVRVVG